MTDGTAKGRGIRALGAAGLVVGLLAPQLVGTPTSGASTVNPQVALAEKLLAEAQDTSKPPAQRALDTARLALDARRESVGTSLLPLIDQEARNLDTAQQLLNLGSPEGKDTLAFGIGVAKIATERQVAALGLDPRPSGFTTRRHGLPSEAVRALVESQGGTLDEAQRADLLRLDALPGEVPMALAQFVDAFAAFDAATRLAYSNGDQVRLENVRAALAAGTLDGEALDLDTPGDLKATLGIDLGPVLRARTELLNVVVPLRDALAELNPAEQLSPGTDFQFAPYYAIELDLGEANTYTQDYMLQLDVGGDDTYLNNAGGAALFRPASTLIDLLGTDQYRSGRGSGINGGGAAGAGLLIDAIGQDSYLAGTGGTNGGGWLGTGLLLDALGPNSFASSDTGTNGGGSLGGAGMLIDVLSASPTSAGHGGTNGGANLAGVGFVFGAANGHSYSAGSNGTNGGGTTGGLGYVFATGLTGDTYSAGSGGVNGGGGGTNTDLLTLAGGVGFLWGSEGSDTYSGGGRGVNGGGTLGVGMLVDALGDDSYFAQTSGTNGGGNGGSGLLVDTSGSDRYQAGSTGTNGGGSFAGVGGLLDANGTDSYTAGGFGVNGGGALGSGILLDGLGANDTYSDSEGGTGTDKTVLPKGSAGAQIDNPPPSPVPTTIPTVTTVPLPTTTLPTVTTTSVPLPTTTLPSTTTSTLPTVTTTTLPTVTTSTLPTVTTTSVPLPTTTLPSTTTSTLPEIPPVIVVDFDDMEPCGSHPINDDSLLGIWHSPAAEGLPLSICVVVHFPIEFQLRITFNPDALNP